MIEWQVGGGGCEIEQSEWVCMLYYFDQRVGQRGWPSLVLMD